MSQPDRRPLRYRGVNLRPEKARPLLFLVNTIVVTLVAAYLLIDVVVIVVRGRNPGFMLWFAAAVIGLLGVWGARRAAARWRGVSAQRRGPDPN
jgi:hypothetical protein